MGDGQRSRVTNSVPDVLDVDTAELVPELRDLFSEYPALAQEGPERACRALHVLRGVRVDVHAIEAVLEALRVEDEVLA